MGLNLLFCGLKIHYCSAPLGLMEHLVPYPPVNRDAVDRRLFTFTPVGGGCNTTSVNGQKK
jgi:hypothetical protein